MFPELGVDTPTWKGSFGAERSDRFEQEGIGNPAMTCQTIHYGAAPGFEKLAHIHLVNYGWGVGDGT